MGSEQRQAVDQFTAVIDMSDFYRVGYDMAGRGERALIVSCHRGSYLRMPIGLEFSTRSREFLCSNREINFWRINSLTSLLHSNQYICNDKNNDIVKLATWMFLWLFLAWRVL